MNSIRKIAASLPPHKHSSHLKGLPVAKAVGVTSQGDRPTKNTYINKSLHVMHKAGITNDRVNIEEFKI